MAARYGDAPEARPDAPPISLIEQSDRIARLTHDLMTRALRELKPLLDRDRGFSRPTRCRFLGVAGGAAAPPLLAGRDRVRGEATRVLPGIQRMRGVRHFCIVDDAPTTYIAVGALKTGLIP